MMSHRGKRQALSKIDDVSPVVATKRRKGRTSTTAEEEETSSLEPRCAYSSLASSSDMKLSSIYNRSVTDAPAELFRKDLISAMKLPDSEPLTSDHYWVITDQWKQEWERGVQVPVKPDSLPGPVVTLASNTISHPRRSHHEFKLPKNKYLRITKDEHFRVDVHYLSNVGIQAEKCCAYDLEDVDVVWLNILNGERALMGLPAVNQDQLERIIEELEIRCWEKVHAIVKKEEGLALEYDESVICDVCRSPDSEDGNEMVFCDCCNICVHQACYGITSIPSGSWHCRTCALGLRPECVLCPNKNGAMKSTRSGQKWAHVSCALWIPEVSIGCVEKMEPITKISSIPQSRWALICVLCRERVGACIQCSVKTCKTAYHVTCAFKHGLEMRAIIDEENTADDDNTVKLRSYCQKHSNLDGNKKEGCSSIGSDEEIKRRQRKDMTTEEKTHARAVKLQEIEAEFEKHVSVKDITRRYDVDQEGLEYIYNYWVLKRRAAFNKPLLPSRREDASDLLHKNQEQVDQEKMRMFVQLRQDLERVRNLCYMVSRREKLSRSYQRYREQTFYKQAAILADAKGSLSTAEITSIKEANHGPSIYDRLYSHANAPDLSTDFETMVHRIAGRGEDSPPNLGLNGYVPSSKHRKGSCFNGDTSKSGYYDSLSSCTSDLDGKSRGGVDTESDTTRVKVNNRTNKSQRRNNVENRIKNTARRRKKENELLFDSTSADEDDKSRKNRKKSVLPKKFGSNRSLSSRSESVSAADGDTEEELFLLSSRRKTKTDGEYKKSKVANIYSSDTDDSTSYKTTSTKNHHQQKPMRTKASVKEFSAAKERAAAGTNGLHRLDRVVVSAVAAAVAKTSSERLVNKLFEDEDDVSDDDSIRWPEKRVKDERLSSESDVFAPQRKSAKFTPSKSKIRTKTSDKQSPQSKKLIVDKKEETSPTNYDMLTLVPQRAAAKKAIKAIEHIKNGMVKPTTVFEDTDADIFRIAKTTSTAKTTSKKSPHHGTSSSKAATKTTSLSSTETTTAGGTTTSINAGLDTEETKFDKLLATTTTGEKHRQSSKSSGVPTCNAANVANTANTAHTAITIGGFVTSSSTAATTTITSGVSATILGKTTTKKLSTSSSGSSSGSSSEDSSSSSSSTYSSSSSSSSSSSTSGESSSSSSSSDSEQEGDAKTLMKNIPIATDAGMTPKLISTNAPNATPTPEPTKPAIQPVPEIRKPSPTTKTEPSEETTPTLPPLEDVPSIDERKSPLLDIRDDNYVDLSSFDDDHDMGAGSGLSLSSLTFNFGQDFAFKEDSKEDSARETLNLVEKLKLEMARKKGEGLDSMASAPTPDVVINHADDEEKENDRELADATAAITENYEKKDDNVLSESSCTLNTSSESEVSAMLPVETDQNVHKSPAPNATPDVYSSCQFHSQNQLVSPTVSESRSSESRWTPNARSRAYDDAQPPVLDSPYHPCVPPTDPRWADSVMMPSQRSDCSSVSSTPSSAYASHNDDAQQADKLSKPVGVDDLLRPATTDNVFVYNEHLSRSGFPPPQPLPYDSLTSFLGANSHKLMNKAFGQPLSIQTPCQATASFTTTSQNMAIINSIISPPVQPPLNSDDTIAATPVSGGSVNYDEKFAEIISEQSTVATLQTSVNKNVMESTLQTQQDRIEQLVKETYNEYREKENMLENVIDALSEMSSMTTTAEMPSMTTTAIAATPSTPSRPLADKNEDKVIDLPSNESAVVTMTPKPDKADLAPKLMQPTLAVQPMPVTQPMPVAQPTPQPQTLNTISSKKSPTKPTRVSARVMSQNKSPVAKSPITAVVSPAPIEQTTTKAKTTRRNNKAGKSSTGNRRGRGRGRGRNPLTSLFYRNRDDDTIRNKLVGTVYDFDDEDESTGDNFENLRAMRERRKSTDIAYCDRLSTSSKDTAYSPRFASPSSQSQPPSSVKQRGSKGSSVASTPDRRGSHRVVQLSPLCEIGNSGRVLAKDAYHDDEEEEPVDEDEEEEEDEENDEKSNVLAAVTTTTSGKNEVTVSPTLPQPPVQSSALEQMAAIPPIQSMIETSVTKVETEARLAATNIDGSISNDELIHNFEKEIRYAVVTPTVRILKQTPSPTTATASPKRTTTTDAIKTTAYSSPNHHAYLDGVQESTSALLDDECPFTPNQLKFKIKGPYSNANYVSMTSLNSATVTIPAANNNVPVGDVYHGTSALTIAASSASAAASSNLRRMRKKELLWQYCSQDANMEECGPHDPTMVVANQIGPVPADITFGSNNNAPVKSGPSYKLPKAVASMTTIPTKEDYKAVLDAAYSDKKKRGKDKSTASSSAYDPMDISNNNTNLGQAFTFNNNNNAKTLSRTSPEKNGSEGGGGYLYEGHSGKRKSRGASSATHPKLKIKIGGGGATPVVVENSVIAPRESNVNSTMEEQKNLRTRPPKKRLCDQSDAMQPPPVFEQLKRESMRFRSKIISEFNENGDRYDDDEDDGDYNDRIRDYGKSDESSKKKRKRSMASGSKANKRKKKQHRSPSRDRATNAAEVVQVIPKQESLKLVFKLRTSSTEANKSEKSTTMPPPLAAVTVPKTAKSSKRNHNHELDSIRTNKTTPIRLKLSRSQKGYVSKSCADDESKGDEKESDSANLLLPNETIKSSISPDVENVEETNAEQKRETAGIPLEVS